MDHCELHLHDYYSPLDGLNSPAEYMARAKEIGMTHLPQTNHGTLGGWREWQEEAKTAGIIPILGVEAYITHDRFDKRAKSARTDGTSIYNHIILLAQNATGIDTILRLQEKAWTEGLYYKPRIDTQLLFEDNEGVIVLSGCMSGMISKALEEGDMEIAERIARGYKDALGDRFFIEVQGHNPIALNEGLLSIADKVGIKPVATSDCHYARKEDLWLEEAMLILSTSPTRRKGIDFAKSQKMDILDRYNYLYPDRKMSFQDIEIFLRDRKTNEQLFHNQNITRTDIYDNTVDIAHSIGEYPFHTGLDLLPRPKNYDPNVLLWKKVKQGIKARGMEGRQDVLDRATEEFKIISDKNYSTYILIVGNMVTWARKQDIPVGPGRGSGAGSLINYLLGITDVDPLKYGLLFFRFIDPARDDFPDIDVDFGDRRRGEVKDYLRRTYGNVASIATFNKFQGKNSIKDAARVFNIDIGDANRATKNNDAPPGADYFEVFDISEQGKEFAKKYPEAVRLAKRLYGKLRGGGMHASGVVLANQPLSNYVPLETAKDPNDKNGPRIPMVAMDMNQAAALGLVKLDVLGLKAMTVIDDTVKWVKERHSIDIKLLELDLADKNVYAMLSEGYTKGVFQCEAMPYTSLIIKMGGVWSFAELAASNALVRPGAMNTIGAEYIARKNGKHMVEYPSPIMQAFTSETYGEVLYQEQVMLCMTELAGMSMSDANKVRGIIGKKKDPVEFEVYKAKFIEGASKNLKKGVAEKLWHDFEAHAGYSFNKSHAVAYSMISYWTAWLKYYYPLEFMAATLRSEADKDVITDYLIESKRLGIKVLLPNVNTSEPGITIQDDGIRLGLTNVKGIGDNVASKILKHRPFTTYAELKEKVEEKGSGLGIGVLSSLNAIGGATFADNPKTGRERDNFYEYLKIPAFEVKGMEPRIRLKFRDLDEFAEKGAFPVLGMVRKIMRGPGWARVEIVDETGNAGIFAGDQIPLESGQMYGILVSDNRIAKYMTMDELDEGVNSSFYKWLKEKEPSVPEGCHRVISFKSHKTKAGKRMAYTVLQDEFGTLSSVLIFPQMFMAGYTKAIEGAIIRVALKETDDGTMFIDGFL